jgi:hypothetical protein
VIPENRLIEIYTMILTVFLAFLASGGLNAGTPSAIASTPVKAVQP